MSDRLGLFIYPKGQVQAQVSSLPAGSMCKQSLNTQNLTLSTNGRHIFRRFTP